ncbi:MAG: glycosyltransferase family protein [Thermoguttaceae bacterium]
MAIGSALLVSGSANFSTRDVWDGYRHALELCGVRVVPYPTFSFLKVLSADTVASDIIGTALNADNRIDCVIFVDGLYFRGKRARVPLSIRRAGIPTVLIGTDDPYEPIPDKESLYTYTFSNEICCATDDTPYLPTATLLLPDVPRSRNPRYDVSFLGTVFEDRLPLLLEVAAFCEREHKRFLVAGKLLGGTESFQHFVQTETRQRTIDTIEKWEIYSQSRLTINLFRQTETAAQSPNPRVFEVTAFGQAALLTGPRREEVTRIYGDAVYHFDDAESAVEAIRDALGDESRRLASVDRARRITLAEHLYAHRAESLLSRLRQGEHRRSLGGTSEDRIAWIIGCGRTGSTWLAEMLGDLPEIRRWHEPYFGRFFRHIHERPDELRRRTSFFWTRHQEIWLQGLRDLFFKVVRDRFPRFGEHSLIVKEVNTPELYGWLGQLFPVGRMILLVRDPLDILDSYLDLQKPGSWNTQFAEAAAAAPQARLKRTAEHIRDSMMLALQAHEDFPLTQRLRISYEELLDDPRPHLAACGELVGVKVDPAVAAGVIGKHRFENYEQTGPLEFRRRGRAGIWRESGNFSDDLLKLALEVLGPLRARLGYPEVN